MIKANYIIESIQDLFSLDERNVINVREIEDWLDSRCQDIEDRDIETWFQKSFLKYLKTEYPETKTLSSVPADSPDWLLQAADRGDELLAVIISQDLNKMVNNLIKYFNLLKQDSNYNTDAERDLKKALKTPMSSNFYKLVIDGLKTLEVKYGIEETGINYSNGFRWVLLKTHSTIYREGQEMGNCLKQYTDKFYSDVTSGDIDLYSLRDSHNKARVSAEVEKRTGDMKQIVGYEDGKVPEEYISYCLDLIKRKDLKVYPKIAIKYLNISVDRQGKFFERGTLYHFLSTSTFIKADDVKDFFSKNKDNLKQDDIKSTVDAFFRKSFFSVNSQSLESNIELFLNLFAHNLLHPSDLDKSEQTIIINTCLELAEDSQEYFNCIKVFLNHGFDRSIITSSYNYLTYAGMSPSGDLLIQLLDANYLIIKDLDKHSQELIIDKYIFDAYVDPSRIKNIIDDILDKGFDPDILWSTIKDFLRQSSVKQGLVFKLYKELLEIGYLNIKDIGPIEQQVIICDCVSSLQEDPKYFDYLEYFLSSGFDHRIIVSSLTRLISDKRYDQVRLSRTLKDLLDHGYITSKDITQDQQVGIMLDCILSIQNDLTCYDYIKYFLDKGFDLSTGTQGSDVLVYAAHMGMLKVVDLLLRHGIDVNVVDSVDGDTPLHAACHQHKVDVVDLLLRRGADVNALSRGGQSPLELVEYKGSKSDDLVDLLKQYGAKA
jgi:hypothetical protein